MASAGYDLYIRTTYFSVTYWSKHTQSPSTSPVEVSWQKCTSSLQVQILSVWLEAWQGRDPQSSIPWWSTSWGACMWCWSRQFFLKGALANQLITSISHDFTQHVDTRPIFWFSACCGLCSTASVPKFVCNCCSWCLWLNVIVLPIVGTLPSFQEKEMLHDRI